MKAARDFDYLIGEKFDSIESRKRRDLLCGAGIVLELINVRVLGVSEDNPTYETIFMTLLILPNILKII